MASPIEVIPPTNGKETRAFGLPAGTITALLALGVVWPYVAYCVYTGEVERLAELALMAMAFYFGRKAG